MKKLVVGISGASGIPLAVRLLKELKKQPDVETHLVMTRGAEMTLHQETPYSLKEICDMADVVYDNHNLGASIASGTFQNDGMIVIPCSMKQLQVLPMVILIIFY